MQQSEMNEYKETVKKIINDKVLVFSIHTFLFNVSSLVLVLITIFNIFINSSEINNFLNSLYNYNLVVTFIDSNKEYLIGLVFYLIFIGFIKSKKGLIFDNTLNQGNFVYFIIIIRDIFGFFIIPYFIYIYFNNIFELAFLLFIGFVSYLITFILKYYILIISDYNLIKDNSLKTNNLFKYNYLIMKFFISFYVLFSLLTIYFGFMNSFNFITIAFLHITFIIYYISLNIVNSGFPQLVDIKFDGKIHKNILIYDRNNIYLFIKDSKDKFIIEKSKVEYIKQKNNIINIGLI